jgi:hypothetical protein
MPEEIQKLSDNETKPMDTRNSDRAQERGKNRVPASRVDSLPERVERFCQLLAEICRNSGEVRR